MSAHTPLRASLQPLVAIARGQRGVPAGSAGPGEYCGRVGVADARGGGGAAAAGRAGAGGGGDPLDLCDFQYVRWSDGIVIVGSAIAAVRRRVDRAAGRAGADRRGGGDRGRRRGRRLELVRKAASARAALVGALEAGGALDFDGDGYARRSAAATATTRDPDVHPGALDVPGDGIDRLRRQDASDRAAAGTRWPTRRRRVPDDLDLLLVTIDTLRADHLGCYGYARPTSPVIDALAAARDAVRERLGARAVDALLDARHRHRPLAVGHHLGRVDLVAAPRARRAHDRPGAARRRLLHRRHVQLQLLRLATTAASSAAWIDYHADRAALHVAVNGPMESHGSSSREMTDDAIAFVDAHRDRKFFLWMHYYDPHLSYEPHPEVPSFGKSRVDLYDGEIRFTDLHLGRLLAHLRTRACGTGRRSSSPAITARGSASTASPSTASISTRRRPRCRSSCACPGCRRGG